MGADITRTLGGGAAPRAAGVAEALVALGGPAPRLPAAWYAGEAAARWRAAAREPGHVGAIDRALVEAWAPLLVELAGARALVELAPWGARRVRAFGAALQASGGGGRCVLHDARAPRLVAAVRALVDALPGLDIGGVIGPALPGVGLGDGGAWPLHATSTPGAAVAIGGAPPLAPRGGASGGGARLALALPGGLDGAGAAELRRALRVLAASLAPSDAAVFVLDGPGADPAQLADARPHLDALGEALVAAGCAPAGARASLELRRGSHGELARLLVLDRLLDGRRADGERFTLDRPIRVPGRRAWRREQVARAAAERGLVLGAWLCDPDERRALVLLRRADACACDAGVL